MTSAKRRSSQQKKNDPTHRLGILFWCGVEKDNQNVEPFPSAHYLVGVLVLPGRNAIPHVISFPGPFFLSLYPLRRVVGPDRAF